jgi:predicted nucleic acid-binding protein
VTDYVLDTFALTGYVQNEPAAARVQELLVEAEAGQHRLLMTTVNLGEALYIAYRRGGPGALVSLLNLVPDLPIRMIDVDVSLAVVASRIKAVLPISFGDCFASALALEQRSTVVTGDPEFQRVAHLIPIEWLPQPSR